MLSCRSKTPSAHFGNAPCLFLSMFLRVTVIPNDETSERVV